MCDNWTTGKHLYIPKRYQEIIYKILLLQLNLSLKVTENYHYVFNVSNSFETQNINNC